MKEWEINVIDDPSLNRDAFPFRSVGDTKSRHHSGKDAGKDKQCQSVTAKDNKWLCPSPVAFDIDQPVAAAEHEEGKAGCYQDVRARPKSFVEREKEIPDPTKCEENDAEEEQT